MHCDITIVFLIIPGKIHNSTLTDNALTQDSQNKIAFRNHNELIKQHLKMEKKIC